MANDGNRHDDNRLPFEFVGTSSTRLSLDPTEFKGKQLDTIAREIQVVLRNIAPDTQFFFDDIVLAAEQVQSANGE